MNKQFLSVGTVLLLTAGALQAQPLPEPHLRAEPDPLYAKVRVDPAISSYERVGPLSGQMRGTHQDIAEWVVKLWTEGFRKVYPSVEIKVELQGPRAAMPSLLTGTTQFAAITREQMASEENVFQEKVGYKPLRIAVAGGSYRLLGYTDALTFFVHKDNPIERLSFAQLDAMYSKTRYRGRKEDINKWGQLGLTGEWADEPIVLWGVKPPNGFEIFLRERILKNGEWKDGINTRDTVFPMPFLVGFSRHSIGYAGFGYVGCAKNVKTIALAENDGGPYLKGTFEEVVSQKYPLSRVIYIYVQKAPGKLLDPKLREFLRFVLSRQGQELVLKDGMFLPLPAEMVKQELAKLE